MPIRAENIALYPPDWPKIRARIMARARYRCEGTPDRPKCRAANGYPHPETGAKVVLTIAHMDRALIDHSDGNLRALCQLCHNGWDAKARALGIKARRRALCAIGDLFGGGGK